MNCTHTHAGPAVCGGTFFCTAGPVSMRLFCSCIAKTANPAPKLTKAWPQTTGYFIVQKSRPAGGFCDCSCNLLCWLGQDMRTSPVCDIIACLCVPYTPQVPYMLWWMWQSTRAPVKALKQPLPPLLLGLKRGALGKGAPPCSMPRDAHTTHVPTDHLPLKPRIADTAWGKP